jgi:hypothetical protein
MSQTITADVTLFLKELFGSKISADINSFVSQNDFIRRLHRLT